MLITRAQTSQMQVYIFNGTILMIIVPGNK